MGACLAVLVEDSEEGSGHHVAQRKAALVVLVEEAEEGPLVVYLDWCVLGEPEYQKISMCSRRMWLCRILSG